MTDERLRAMAAKIAADLFTNGDDRKAERLVMMMYDDRYGWSESAVRDRIYAALKEGMEGE